MQFVWDLKKARRNEEKHGVSFELARLVFDDPFVVSVPDDYEIEQRWRTLGLVKGILILVVVHTLEDREDEEIIRIISARKATPHERKGYEDRRPESRR